MTQDQDLQLELRVLNLSHCDFHLSLVTKLQAAGLQTLDLSKQLALTFVVHLSN